MDETTAGGTVGGGTRPDPWTTTNAAELLLGLAAVGVGAAGRVVDRVWPASLVITAVTMPLRTTVTGLGGRVRRSGWSQDLARRGRSERRELARRADQTARRVIGLVVEALLDLVDLTDIVIEHVDLDAVVRAVDLDAAVARVDLDAAVARVDLDAAVARADLDGAVARVDIGAILDRLDLDAIVARVDLDAAVARADLDAAVARVDIGAIVDRLGLGDIGAKGDIDAIAQRLDIDAVVARLDLVGLAEYVVEEIDLPGIIQSSSGAMASEGMREVRWQGVGGDERVAHLVDRVLRRRPRDPGLALPGAEIPPAAELPVAPVLPGPAG